MARELIASDIDEAGAKSTTQEIIESGGNSASFTCDISNPQQVDALFAWIDEKYGRIDILVNVPYTFPSRTRPHELKLEDWQKTLAVNLTGYFLCSQGAIQRMIAQGSGGSIVNISSIAGVRRWAAATSPIVFPSRVSTR